MDSISAKAQAYAFGRGSFRINAEEAAITRWLAQVYNSRGLLNAEVWPQFAAFILRYGFHLIDVAPGVRIDERDPWVVLERALQGLEP